ncbi:MAG: hypothetical protein AAGF15_12430, partial [Pseudomonadota bacterium]
ELDAVLPRFLPRNAVLVARPANADIVVRVNLNNVDLRLRTLDRDFDRIGGVRANRRLARAGCFGGTANFTRVEAKAVARFNADLSFETRGFRGGYQDQVRGRVSDIFHYAEDDGRGDHCWQAGGQRVQTLAANGRAPRQVARAILSDDIAQRLALEIGEGVSRTQGF